MHLARLLSLPLGVFALGVFALGCAEADRADDDADTGAAAGTTEEYPGGVAADPDHYSVEFENDAVRLVRIEYGPGEESVMHMHPANCSVALGDASWQMTDSEGAVTQDSASLGDVECGEATVHLPQNRGSGAAELILVEFKPDATAGSDSLPEHPDAVTADPDHYSVEFENDVARLIRITYGPGETSVMHRHPANCAIFLSDQPTTMELPSGEVVENPARETGDVECSDAGAHLPTNAGDEGLELILVELEGRAALQ